MESEDYKQQKSEEDTQIEEIKKNWYSPLTKVTSLSKTLAFILFITLPFLGFWIGYENAETKIIVKEKIVEVGAIKTSQTNPEEREDQPFDISDKITYVLEPVDPNASWGEAGFFDQVLIKKMSGQTEVLIPSIVSEIVSNPVLADSLSLDISRYSFEILSNPNESDVVILYAYIPDTDSGVGPYFKYTESTGFIELFKNTLNFGFVAPREISTDGRYAAGLLNDTLSKDDGFDWPRDIVIVDLLNDIYTKLGSVSKNETLVKSGSFFGMPEGEFKWIGNNILEYSVFSTLEKDIDEYGTENNALIEKRIVEIPDETEYLPTSR